LTEDPALDELRRFLRDYVSSYEELEVLLLLHSQPEHIWRVAEILAELKVSGESILPALRQLEARGLLSSVPGEVDRFAFAPEKESLRHQVEQLATAYQSKRLAVVQIMSTNAVDRIRTAAIHTFAEAFRFRDPKNGR
jgi:hypothetical protein